MYYQACVACAEYEYQMSIGTELTACFKRACERTLFIGIWMFFTHPSQSTSYFPFQFASSQICVIYFLWLPNMSYSEANRRQHSLVLYCDLIEGSYEMVPDHLVWNQAVCRPQLDMECLVIAMLFCVLLRLKKGRGTVRSLLTVQRTCMRNSPLTFVSNITLTNHENLQAAKEKQNIPAKSHSSGATDVKKHQACVSGLDQQILKQHHLPLDCWEDWWRAQTMLRWLTETWMDTTRKTSLRKLRQVTTLNTSHHRHRQEVRRRREAVTGKGRNSFLFFPFTIVTFFSCTPLSQRNTVAQGEYYNPFRLR